jgi:hypothetical protein
LSLISFQQFVNLLQRQQENISFANFGRVSAGAVCKCDFCVSAFFIFFVFMQQKFHCHSVVVFFLRLACNYLAFYLPFYHDD